MSTFIEKINYTDLFKFEIKEKGLLLDVIENCIIDCRDIAKDKNMNGLMNELEEIMTMAKVLIIKNERREA